MLVVKKPERTDNQASVKSAEHGPSFEDVERVTLMRIFGGEYVQTSCA
jgi:hypothetical protein